MNFVNVRNVETYLRKKRARKNNTERKSRIYVVPGFLTEQSSLPHGIYPIAELKNEPWARKFRECPQVTYNNIYIVNWPSNNLKTLLKRLYKSLIRYEPKSIFNQYLLLNTALKEFNAFLYNPLSPILSNEILSVWSEAVSSAEEYSAKLADSIEGFENVILMGHSLGGRIVLRVGELLSKKYINLEAKNIPGIISLAPAIKNSEIDLSILNDMRSDVEVFYSKYDMILKVLYKVGEKSLGTTIGELGVNDVRCNNIMNYDVSSCHGRQLRGHTHYESDILPLLESNSRLWRFFKKQY